MLLAFPILLPLLTAIVLQLLPHRPELLRSSHSPGRSES